VAERDARKPQLESSEEDVMANGQQWYMAIGGRQVGPVGEDEIISNLKNGSIDSQSLVFTTGMSGWTAVRDVPQFAAYLGSVAGPKADAVYTPPLASGRRAHEIDYKIFGEDLQFVEIELDPGESAVAEAGAMMYMTAGIEMETIFGDGSGRQQSGLMGALIGAGKRVLTGESLFMTLFGNRGSGKERVAFAAPYAGRILTMDLAQLGGQLICQKDSFLCAARGVSIGIAFQKKIGVGLFGGEGFIMQKLEGDGLCFVHAGGMLHMIDLQPGETLRVDTGCLVALLPSVNYDVQFVGKIKTAFFGGEGMFFATLTGPGRVWLQSLPLSRLADRIYKAAPQQGGHQEEGSVLGGIGLGKILGGD
jgi:uncharacterized protein (TIGR00266 family)